MCVCVHIYFSYSVHRKMSQFVFQNSFPSSNSQLFINSEILHQILEFEYFMVSHTTMFSTGSSLIYKKLVDNG